MFYDATRIGDTPLRRGRYRVEHRDDHAVVLTELNWLTPRASIWRPDPVRLELRGELEPLDAPSRESEVHVVREGRICRITRMSFKGESTAHVFPAGRARSKEKP